MGTNEIMEALKGVQMTAKNKSKLANSIMKASGGQNVVVKEPLMKYYYYKNELIEDKPLYEWLRELMDSDMVYGFNLNVIFRAVEDHDNRDIPMILSDRWFTMSGFAEISAICVHGMTLLNGLIIDLSFILATMIIGKIIDINSVEFKGALAMAKELLKPLEITEEEFFEGINTSL